MDKNYLNLNQLTQDAANGTRTVVGIPKASTDTTLVSEFKTIDANLTEQYLKQVEELHKLLAIAEDAARLGNERDRIIILATLSMGLRKSGEALRWVTYHQKSSYARRKQAEGIAALDEYSKYLASKRTEGQAERPTNEMRNYYVHTNNGVISANRMEAMINAMYEDLATLREEFRQSISTLRAISYGPKDSGLMSSASVSV